MIDLSICILTWNTKDLTIKCIESIVKNTEKINYEIILVDNGSTDGTIEYVKKNYNEFKVIRNEKNVGFTKANNQALKVTKGRYALILNSDTEIKKNCLDIMIDYMDRDKDVGMSCCKMLYPDNSLYFSIGENYPNWKNVLAERSIISELFFQSKLHKYFLSKYYTTNKRKYEKDHSIKWVLGAFMIVRREVIEKVGIFDENIFSYFEEYDWCKRTYEAGYKIKFYNKPVVIHHSAKSVIQEYTELTKVWHLSRLYFFKKHYGFFSMLFLKFITALGILVRFNKYKKQIHKCNNFNNL